MSSTAGIAILLDLIVLGLLALGIAMGYVQGFIKTAFKLVSWVLTLFFTHVFYPYTVRILKLTPLPGKISEILGNVLRIPVNAADNAMSTISNLKIPAVLKNSLIENNNYEVYDLLGVHSLAEYINAYLTNMVINALAILITFLVVLLLLKLAVVLLDIVDKLPVIHTLNHFLGLMLGVVNGVILVWIFCLLLTSLGAFEKFEALYPAISSSILTNLFYNHNLLLNSILKIFTH